MMTARPRRSFTPEFKAQTVELICTSGKSVAEVYATLSTRGHAVRVARMRQPIRATRLIARGQANIQLAGWSSHPDEHRPRRQRA